MAPPPTYGNSMDEYREEALAVLTLTLCKGVSSGTVYALTEHFGSARAALAASLEELRRVDGVGPAIAESVRHGPGEQKVARELDLMERHKTRLVPFFSEDYPPPLKHLERDAPACLRMKGEYRPADRLAVAIVGSRRCSTYGRQQASRLACDLATMGFTVVSGLAAGIDTAAHRGALLGKGRTLAVLGCGLAYELPPEGMALAADVAGSGALLSELPMEAPPRPGNFPPRNRLVSGLALGVVVVEASTRSGSLITARQAGEQGRGVFAVPGPVDRPTSRGCHQLIRDGAVLVEDARDVVEGLGPLSEPIALPPRAEAATDADAEAQLVLDPRVMALNERERQIYDMLERDPLHIDEVVSRTQLPPSIVSSTLLTLEIRGLIRQMAGNRYVRPQ
jgi:DNA processing protein